MITAPKAVIFDWDNTLVDTWPAITKALNATRAVFKLDPWSQEYACAVGSARSARHNFSEWFGDRWEEALALFYETYGKYHLELLKPMAGAEDLLDTLRKRDIPVFVVSNKDGSVLRREAAHLNWSDRFASIVGSKDAPRDKPERDPVDLALSAAEMRGDDPRVWFVGDSESDILCAKNAGLTSVLLHASEGSELQLRVGYSFSDCHTMETALNNNFRL